MTIDHRPLAYEVGPLTITGFGLAVLPRSSSRRSWRKTSSSGAGTIPSR